MLRTLNVRRYKSNQIKIDRQLAYGWLVLLVLVTLVQIGTRLIGLLVFPAFIDESLHINMAQDVVAGNWLAGAAHGKLLVPIALAALHPTGQAQLFIGRAATALVSLLSFGLVYRLTTDFAGRRAGLIAIMLYIFTPYLIFYERLALIDTYMMTCGLFAIWAASRMSPRFDWRTAFLCALALSAGLAAKATSAALLVIPFCALILHFRRVQWQTWLRWLMVCYGTIAVIWLPLYGLMRLRHVNYFGLAETLSNTNDTTNFAQRLLANLTGLGQIDATYFSAIALLTMLSLAIWWCIHDWRRAGYFCVCGAVPTLIIMLLSPTDRPRYLIYHVPLIIIAAAAGYEKLWQIIGNTQLQQSIWRLGQAAFTIFALLGLASAAVPFFIAGQTNPAALNLPEIDKSEYITADSAGFALPEIAKFVSQQTSTSPVPVHMIGLLANCTSLQLYLATNPNITLDCPILAWDGSQQSAVAKFVNHAALQTNRALFVVIEDLTYVSQEGITTSMKMMKIFHRPESNSQLTVYQVASQSE